MFSESKKGQPLERPERDKEVFTDPNNFVDDIRRGFDVESSDDSPSEFANQVKSRVSRRLDQLNLDERTREVVIWFNQQSEEGDDALKSVVDSDIVVMVPSSGVAENVAKQLNTSRLRRRAQVAREFRQEETEPARPSRIRSRERQITVTASNAEVYFGRPELGLDSEEEPISKKRKKTESPVVVLDSGLQTISGVDFETGFTVMKTRQVSQQEINRRRDSGEFYIPLYDESATGKVRPGKYSREIPNETYLADFDSYALELLKEKMGEPANPWVKKLRENLTRQDANLVTTLDQTATEELASLGCLDQSGQVTAIAQECLEQMAAGRLRSVAEARTLVEAKRGGCLNEVRQISQLIDDPKNSRLLSEIESRLFYLSPSEEESYKSLPLLEQWQRVSGQIKKLLDAQHIRDDEQQLGVDKKLWQTLKGLAVSWEAKAQNIQKSFIAGHLPLLAKHWAVESEELKGSYGYPGHIELVKDDRILDNPNHSCSYQSCICHFFDPRKKEEALLFVADKVVGFGSTTNKTLLNGQDKQWQEGDRNKMRANDLSVPKCLTTVSPEILEELSPYLYHKIQPWLESQQKAIEAKKLAAEEAAQKEKERLEAEEAEKIAAKERRNKPASSEDIRGLKDFFKNR